MGKNRRRNPTQYITESGETVETHNHSSHFMKTFNDKISDWIHKEPTVGKSPTSEMTKKEIKYLESMMEDSENNRTVEKGQLTRCERSHHILDENGNLKIKVGDKLPNKEFRSYSRTRTATLKYLKPKRGTVVIYRTKGNVKHFNATKFDDYYGDERESFVDQSKLKVDKITRIKKSDFGFDNAKDLAGNNSNGFNQAVSDELGTKTVKHLRNTDEVILVDVSSTE